MRCWEDFVLSEGTVTYLAARSLEAADASVGTSVWQTYYQRLNSLVASGGGGIAWPASCGEVDVLDIFNDAPYIKGAYFYRAVEHRVGRDVLDTVLADFYQVYRGEEAGMQDMLDTIETNTGWDPTACAVKWLQTDAVPADRECS
jgi:aminopeptidase N